MWCDGTRETREPKCHKKGWARDGTGQFRVFFCPGPEIPDPKCRDLLSSEIFVAGLSHRFLSRPRLSRGFKTRSRLRHGKTAHFWSQKGDCYQKITFSKIFLLFKIWMAFFIVLTKAFFHDFKSEFLWNFFIGTNFIWFCIPRNITFLFAFIKSEIKVAQNRIIIQYPRIKFSSFLLKIFIVQP